MPLPFKFCFSFFSLIIMNSPFVFITFFVSFFFLSFSCFIFLLFIFGRISQWENKEKEKKEEKMENVPSWIGFVNGGKETGFVNVEIVYFLFLSCVCVK